MRNTIPCFLSEKMPAASQSLWERKVASCAEPMVKTEISCWCSGIYHMRLVLWSSRGVPSRPSSMCENFNSSLLRQLLVSSFSFAINSHVRLISHEELVLLFDIERKMSEESKTPEGDYMMMGGAAAPPAAGSSLKLPSGLDDPNLTQEDRDYRLAIALQQQENSVAYDEHKKKHDQAVKANVNRTARSGTFSKLAAIRDRDGGMLSVPAEYTTENAYVSAGDNYMPPAGKSDEDLLKGATPAEIADFKLAKELQKVEQVGAGTAREVSKILSDETKEIEAQKHRTEHSNYHIPQKPRGIFKKN